ncbi:hypothetical protein F4803DRAFT_578086 [Xylaria telfairii]|nr:hypothetical protein F4803DRAFT_578086 [Xylaria telfairii]
MNTNQCTEEEEEKEGFLPYHEECEVSSSAPWSVLSRVRWPKILGFLLLTSIVTSVALIFTRYYRANEGDTRHEEHQMSHQHTEDGGRAKEYFDMLKAERPYIMESPCGSTPEEAIERGCKFDVISFCWQAPQCYDEELSQGFDELAVWEWFLDAEKTQPLARQEVMTGTFDNLHVNWEYHLQHCTAMWLKMHRAIVGPHGKAAIDSYIGSIHHTEHCGQMLVEDRDMALSTMNTLIRIKYPHCGMT